MKRHSFFRIYRFQSTLSMRRATECFSPLWTVNLFQSTLSMRRATVVFGASARTEVIFQSTLSMRRATPYFPTFIDYRAYFNPRSP